MKRLWHLGVVIAVLVAGGVGALAGVALAQQDGWMTPLVEEYSLIWKSAYDETAWYGLTPAGRDAVAEQVLEAYVSTRSASSRTSGVPAPVGNLDQPTLTPAPAPSQTLTPTPAPGPSPTPMPVSLTISDIDGYRSEFRIEIFVSSIGLNLAMSRRNIFTAGGRTVKLASDGTLKMGIIGTDLADRYYWSCNPVNGSTGVRRYYASDEYSAGLPKTDLSNAPLLESSFGQRVNRICAGKEAVPSSSTSTSWGTTTTLVTSIPPSAPSGTAPTPTPAGSAVDQPTTTPTVEPSLTPTPEPGKISASDVDGYHSEYRIEIFVSSIGVNLTMSRVNTYTADRATVKRTADGTLTTGIGGTVLRDRYSWSCNPVNGSTGESRSYATDSHSVGLPKTDLSNAPLRANSFGQRVLRICAGNESAPSSTDSRGWGEFNSF